MSQHSSSPSPARRGLQVTPRAALYDDEDHTSSLQALINILRQPRERSCVHCLGRGTYLGGGSCEHCAGRGEAPSSSRWR